MTDAALLPLDVRRYLPTHTVGRRLYYYPETGSTNDAAGFLARGLEPEGTVVYADFQRHGRGRLDHRWHGARNRDLLFSVVLRPLGTPREVLGVTLALAVAISVALAKATGAEVGLEWPNDVVSSGRKIAGILAESGADEAGGRYVVVGVGVNVNSLAGDLPDDIRAIATSCRELSGSPVDRAWLFADVLGAIEAYYDRFRRDGFGPLVSAYEERLVMLGRRVRFEREAKTVTAEVLGVGPDGALRVDVDGVEAALYSEIVETIS